MRALLQNPLWHTAQHLRAWQKQLGVVSGIFLAIALFALIDGLIAQMRTGNNEQELLPGETLTISGPAALKNPLSSDVRATFKPPAAPLVFELEGFFTGYWFGSGMWRGKVTAREDAETGRYELRIAFRGASANNAQTYIFTVFSDAVAMREASFSLLRRLFGLNPFLLAAWTGLGGVIAGFGTYFFGRRFAQTLHELGLAEIYSRHGQQLWCLVPKNLVPPHGNSRLVLNEDGTVYGEARAAEWKKGKLCLQLLDQDNAPKNGFICLRHPTMPDSHEQ